MTVSLVLEPTPRFSYDIRATRTLCQSSTVSLLFWHFLCFVHCRGSCCLCVHVALYCFQIFSGPLCSVLMVPLIVFQSSQWTHFSLGSAIWDEGIVFLFLVWHMGGREMFGHQATSLFRHAVFYGKKKKVSSYADDTVVNSSCSVVHFSWKEMLNSHKHSDSAAQTGATGGKVPLKHTLSCDWRVTMFPPVSKFSYCSCLECCSLQCVASFQKQPAAPPGGLAC